MFTMCWRWESVSRKARIRCGAVRSGRNTAVITYHAVPGCFVTTWAMVPSRRAVVESDLAGSRPSLIDDVPMAGQRDYGIKALYALQTG